MHIHTIHKIFILKSDNRLLEKFESLPNFIAMFYCEWHMHNTDN